MSTKKSEHYELLIKFIRDKLEKKEEWRKALQKVKQEESRPLYGLKFTSFGSQSERNEFVEGLIEETNRVDDFLNLVAGRNHERHKELVSLLVEQFEIERELVTKEPKGAGGFYHETCARERLTEIKERIEEIINEENVCQA